MKTRIIQDDHEPRHVEPSGDGAHRRRPRAPNLAARMAHWSAGHRKVAIFGWLAFVLVAFMVGSNLGTKEISDLDTYSGEAREAELALDRAGLRPVEEVVFIQSDEFTVRDPEFRAVVEDVTGRLAELRYVANVKSPLTGDGEVSADGHAALVGFEIRGDSTEAKQRVDPSLAAVAAVQAGHANFDIEQFGGASANQAVGETIGDDLKKAGELSVPITLIILIVAFGSLVAAGLPLLIGITAVVAALGLVAIPSHLLPVDESLAAVVLMIGLAVGVDYSLFYLRREREERAAGRSERAALEAAAATSGRAVLISGVTVIVAMAGMLISGDKSFISIAEGAIVVVAVAMFASLTVLPAILAWLGDRVEKGRIPVLGGRRRPAGQSRFWMAVTGARDAAPGSVDPARGRSPGGPRDTGATAQDRHQRHRPAPAGPARDRDLQQGQGRVPGRGRGGHRGGRGRRRSLGRGGRRHLRSAAPRSRARTTSCAVPRWSTATTALSHRSTSRPAATAPTPRP